jgi:hypothetical protein
VISDPDVGSRPATTAPAPGEHDLIAVYFVIQAVVGVALWLVVGLWRPFRALVELVPDHPRVVDAFLLPDIVVIVTGSLATAWALRSRRGWAPLAAAFTAGAVVYPTVFLAGWFVRGGEGAGAALMVMLPPAICSCWLTVRLWAGRG